MKISILSFLLFSAIFSAQTELADPPKNDSIDIFKPDPAFTAVVDQNSIDSAITKLYKMPVAKPKNPERYSILRASVKNYSSTKIPNSMEKFNERKLKEK